MSTAETVEQIPPGLYHIAVAGHRPHGSEASDHHDRLLTDHDGQVTISPAPSARPDRNQVWQVDNGRKHGTIIIKRPGPIRPPLSVTFKGDHAHPKENDKIVLGREEFPTEWDLDQARGPGRHYYIRVPGHGHGKQLGIALGPEKIHPPVLQLEHERQLEWEFKRILRRDGDLEDEA